MRAWVDRETLRVNRISARRDPPIVVEHPGGRQERVNGLTFTGAGRMVYDSSCQACASVVLELDAAAEISLERP